MGILQEQEVIGRSVSAACANVVGRVPAARISGCQLGQREERAFRCPAEGWAQKSEGAHCRGTPALYSFVPIALGE